MWRREALLAGNRIAGPAIVEEISATTVLYPGDRAHVDAIGSLIVELTHRAESEAHQPWRSGAGL